VHEEEVEEGTQEVQEEGKKAAGLAMRAREIKAAILAAGVAATLLLAGSAKAGTFTVNSTADPGDGVCTTAECTLHEAIVAANSAGDGDTIPISVGGTITLNGALPDLTTPMQISGPGAGLLDIHPVFGPYFRIFTVAAPAGISGLTASGGVLFANEASAIEGGGIRNAAGNQLTLDGVAVTGNLLYAGGNTPSGESAANGGGIFNAGTLIVRDSLIAGNAAEAASGSTARPATTRGGGIYNDGTLVLERSTVRANHLNVLGSPAGTTLIGTGGGIHNGGAATATLTGTTVSDNTNSNGVVEVSSSGGGITNSGTLGITNSTLSGNIADDYGGGIDNFGANATTTLNSVTIAGNRANNDNDGFGDGGGTQSGSVRPARISATNTLYYGNTVTGAGQGPQCSGYDTTSGGYNLRSTADTFCTGFTGPGDIVNNGFALGPLAANGGATLTASLPSGAPAVNAGSPLTPGSAADACPATDQRDLLRGFSAGRCDIGAFELGALAAPPGTPPAVSKVKKCKKKKKGKKRAALAKKKKCKKRKTGH
jgi:CSLREA domain-containing protein